MRLLLVIGAVILVGGALLLIQDGPPDIETLPPANAHGDDVRDAARTAPEGPRAASVRTVQQADDDDVDLRPDSPTTLTLDAASSETIGVVVSSARDGRPLRDAEVRLSPARGASRLDQAVGSEIRTDAQGAVSFRVPAAGAFELVIHADGHRSERRRDVRPGAVLRVELAAADRQEGVVVDAWTGAGVPDALIVCDGDVSVRSRADGRFVLPGLPLDGAPVEVLATGYRVERVLLTPAANPITLRLSNARRLPGSVWSGRAPLRGARVRVIAARMIDGEENDVILDEVETGPDGGFEVGLATEDDATLIVEAEGHLGAEFDLDDDLPEHLTVALDPARALEGIVRLQDGRPAAHARIRLFDVSAVDAPVRRIEADAQGRFSFPAVRERALRVGASHPEGSPAVVDLPATPRAAPLELVLPARARVSGRVRRSDGLPAAYAELHVVTDDDDGALQRVAGVRERLRCDETGAFRIDGLPPGSWRILARHGDAAGGRAVRIEPGDDLTADVDIVARLAIEGRVQDRDGAVAGARVRAHSERETADREAWTDGDGRFRLGGFDPGDEVELEIDADDRWSAEVDVVVAPGAPTVVVTLTRTGVLAGRVIDATTGRAIDRFALSVDYPDPDDPDDELTRKRAVAAGDGAFRLDELPVGLAALSVRSDGYETWGPSDVDIGDGLAPVEVRMAPGREVRGRLVDTLGRPIAGVFARLEPDGDATARRLRKSRSRPDGRFRVRDLEPGSWQLRVGVGDDDVVRRPIEGRPGVIDVGDLRVATVGRMHVRVTDEAGRPLAGRQVFVESPVSRTEVSALSGDDGVAELNPLLADEYEVRCGGTRRTAVVGIGSTASVELTLADMDEDEDEEDDS